MRKNVEAAELLETRVVSVSKQRWASRFGMVSGGICSNIGLAGVSCVCLRLLDTLLVGVERGVEADGLVPFKVN